MSQVFKRELVFALTGLVTIVMFADYFFFPDGWAFAQTLQQWGVIVFNISLGLGAVTLLKGHTMIVTRKRKNWQFSAWLLVMFALTILTGLVGYFGTGQQTGNSIFNWLFTHIYVPLDSTLYATTGFYIFSAAYRAFRARNVDAALMLIAGCFVILSNAPIGEVIWGGIPVIGEWFRFTGQVPGMRTFSMVGALGMIAYGFRALLGKERGFYAGGGE